MSPRVLRPRSVFAPVPALVFNAHQYDTMRRFLVQRTEHTELVPISDEGQLLMAADGRLLESGYRFNSLGFQAFAAGACAGLASLFCSLAGEYQQRTFANIESDLPAAVSVYNTVVRARMEMLRERALLVDHRERVVDGFSGLQHKLFSNVDFLDVVREEVTALKPTAVFQKAELVGRELTVYYIDPSTLRKDIYPDAQSPHSLVGAWVFANREDQGKSLRALCGLLTKFGAAYFAANTQDRVVHVGSDLVGRARQLIVRSLQHELDMNIVLHQVDALQKQPLGIIGTTAAADSAFQAWQTYICKAGMRVADARLIVRNALTVGADVEPQGALSVLSGDAAAQRTAYDLWCAILRFANNEPTSSKERLRALAMRMVYPRSPRKRKGK